MLYVDIPTLPEFKALTLTRNEICVSLYLRTTPLTQEAEGDRIELKNLAKQALDQLRAGDADKASLSAIEEQIEDIVEDDEFWRFQARSLAVLATPDAVQTFRLPNLLQPTVEVSDRFHLTPLLRAITFPHSAYILALAQGSVRLVEVFADLPATEIKVPDMPKDAASAVGRSSVRDRSPSRRIHGSEGQKVLLRSYSRQVDQALRGLLAGREEPLILATLPPLDGIYRSVNSYPHLLADIIDDSPENLSDAELAAKARPILDAHYQTEIASFQEKFGQGRANGVATSDLASIARAATFGAVEALLVDIDASIPGQLDESDGKLTMAAQAGASSYDIVDEISGRALVSGARVLGVRKADLPDTNSPVAAILRYPI